MAEDEKMAINPISRISCFGVCKNRYFSMSTAGFPPKKDQDSIENIITFQTEKIQFILSVMSIFWISTHIYIIYIYSIYNLFIPSAPFGHQQKKLQLLCAWRSEECSDLREDCPSRSRRCGPPPKVILQCRSGYPRKAIKFVKIGLHHVTSILVCSHTAPYYIPGILCWEIFWVCNSPWAIGHVTRQVTNWGSSLQPLEVFPLSLKQYTVFLDGENEWQHQFIDESISPLDDMVESTRLIMFHDCDPPPRYYAKASSHCWIPYVWCQNPHLWSAKKLSNYPNTTFCLLKHGKTLRFFPFLHVFFVRILRHPAWRKATRHTLNKAQLTANKGRARTLLQGTTITCVTCVMGELCGLKMSQVSSIFGGDFICIYAWLCANPLWPSALWIFRLVQ